MIKENRGKYGQNELKIDIFNGELKFPKRNQVIDLRTIERR